MTQATELDEPTIAERAEWADRALQMYQMTTGCDRDDAVSDLLANLMHLADQEGTNFYTDLARAREHYLTESAESADESACPFSPNVPS